MMWTNQHRIKYRNFTAIHQGKGCEICLILIHGVGLRAEVWAGVMQQLPKSLEVIAIDLPAHGESDQIPMQDISDLADNIRMLREASLPYFVVGHSLGALIALDIAQRFPDNLLGVGLLHPVYQRDKNASDAVKTRAHSLQAGNNNPQLTLNRWFGEAYPTYRKVVGYWLKAGGKGYAAAYQVFANYQDLSESRLRKIQTPFLIITGERDANSTPTMARALSNVLPNTQTKIIKDAAHMALMTHSTAVSALIKAFISENAISTTLPSTSNN